MDWVNQKWVKPVSLSLTSKLAVSICHLSMHSSLFFFFSSLDSKMMLTTATRTTILIIIIAHILILILVCQNSVLVYVLVLAAMACSHGEVSPWLNGVQCVHCCGQWHREQDGCPGPTSKWRRKKTQRRLFSQSHAIRLQTDACTGSQSEATALPQWCEELYLNVC